jgi:hypothetical protein
MTELKGFEEHKGLRREMGVSHGAHLGGRTTWLEVGLMLIHSPNYCIESKTMVRSSVSLVHRLEPKKSRTSAHLCSQTW